MHRIGKQFTFEAAHRLLGHPKCGRLHGHSYKVIVYLEGELNGGMVRDYADLSIVKKYIDENLDHRYLVSEELVEGYDSIFRACRGTDYYTQLPVERTTAELLSKYLYEYFKPLIPELSGVMVCETENTMAEYSPEGS